MRNSEELNRILHDNLGYLHTAEAISAGVSGTSLKAFVKENQLERVAHGIYLAQDAWRDFHYETQSRYPRAIWSHETALYFHNLTDREPLQHTLTMATSMGVTRLSNEGIKVYRIKDELFEIGLSETRSSFGHVLRCYDAERTICDILRYKDKIDIQDLQVALNTYFHSSQKNLSILIKYASIFSVENLVRQYAEVLLT